MDTVFIRKENLFGNVGQPKRQQNSTTFQLLFLAFRKVNVLVHRPLCCKQTCGTEAMPGVAVSTAAAAVWFAPTTDAAVPFPSPGIPAGTYPGGGLANTPETAQCIYIFTL